MRLPIVLTGFVAGLIPGTVLAQINFNNINTCPVTTISGVGCFTGALNPNTYILNLVTNTGNAWSIASMFGALLLAMLLYYPIRLVMGSREDSSVTETRTAYAHAIFGTALVGGSILIANAFTANDGLIVNAQPINTVLYNVIVFFKALLGTLLIGVIGINALRLILVQDDSQMGAARGGLIRAFLGSAVVILANAFVTFIFNRNIGIASSEILGVISFLMTALGGLSVLGIIVAGIMLVIGTEDAAKDKARKLVVASVVSLAVTITSYGLVTIFII